MEVSRNGMYTVVCFILIQCASSVHATGTVRNK